MTEYHKILGSQTSFQLLQEERNGGGGCGLAIRLPLALDTFSTTCVMSVWIYRIFYRSIWHHGFAHRFSPSQAVVFLNDSSLGYINIY